MSKTSIILLIALTACMGKTTGDKVADSTDLRNDSIIASTTFDNKPTQSNEAELTTIEIQDDGFVYMPYDFPLDSNSIKDRLGPDTEVEVQEFEGGEDYGAYSITTVTKGYDEVSFYSFAGKHSASIFTKKLPLQKGIMVGMKRTDFTAIWSLTGKAALADQYIIPDNFGSVKFVFAADTLRYISVFYEEGD